MLLMRELTSNASFTGAWDSKAGKMFKLHINEIFTSALQRRVNQ
jgi:hypothetical protein